MANRYRGRRGASKGFRNFLIIILVLAVLFAAAFFYLQRFMVYTDEGAYLDLPFLKAEKPQTPPPEITLEVLTPTEKPEENMPQNTPDSIQIPRASVTTLRAVFVPAADLSNQAKIDAYIKLCKDTGINALIIEMKAESGELNFISAVPSAAASEASGKSDAAPAIRKLKAEDIYLGAYVSCFKDNIAPRKVQTMSVRHISNVIWLDARMTGWLNPYDESAQEYITDLCGELADLGFDEIILDNLTFPTVGRLNEIDYKDYASVSKTSCINAFTGKLRESLMQKGVILSAILGQKTVTEGLYADAGQDLAELADLLYRVFVPVGAAKAADEYDAVRAGMLAVLANPDDAKEKLVPVITLLSGTGASDSLKTTLDIAGGSHGLGYLVTNPQGIYTTAEAVFK